MNPVRDLEIISEELRLKDVQYLTKNIVCCGLWGRATFENASCLI